MTPAAYAWIAGATLILMAYAVAAEWIGDRLDPPDRHDKGGE